MNNSIYLDNITSGHLGTLPDNKRFRNFRSKSESIILPNLSHCGIKTKFEPQLSPVQAPDGRILKPFKWEALEYGRKVSAIETRLVNRKTFQSMNHTVYLNKIMAQKDEEKRLQAIR